MNVLIDYVGHQDLYYSLYALFEKRLGYKLYMLDASDITNSEFFDSYSKKLGYHCGLVHDGFDRKIYNDYVANNLAVHRLLSFQEFINTKIDIIVATSYERESIYYELYQKYKPCAKFIRQIGNIIEKPQKAKNVLLALNKALHFDEDINVKTYHPEHRNCFLYNNTFIPGNYILGGFNYCHPEGTQGNDHSYSVWKNLEKNLPEFKFELKNINTCEFPAGISNCKFYFHIKLGGCCGFTARQVLFSGRPLIVDKRYVTDYLHYYTLAYAYLKDGINCIDLNPDLRSFEENIELIKEWSDPNNYLKRCDIGYEYTKSVINFEKESIEIKEWINNI